MRRSFIEAVKQDPNVDLSTIQSGASGFGIPDLKRESPAMRTGRVAAG